MKKEEFMNLVDSLNLDNKDYCIISGGALLLHGLKESTHDVDIYVNKTGFNKLNNQFKIEKTDDNKYKVKENVECFLRDDEYLEKERVVVNGYSLQSLEKILELKLELNRPKDLEDIKALRKVLNM